MTPERLAELLDGFDKQTVLVVGDLFLDKYLMIDPALAETSLETGQEAHQVVEIRTSPGAAGTVVANLIALEVKQARLLSIFGKDGEGADLTRALDKTGRHPFVLCHAPERLTPTYTKPMRLVPGAPAVEMNRFDHKNRLPLPESTKQNVLTVLRKWVPEVQAVIIADQVEERNCGVITDTVRAELARLAEEFPQVIFFADSRVRIGEFRGCIIKPNMREAVLALNPDGSALITRKNAEAAARTLAARNGKPVFLTLGEEGMAVADGDFLTHVSGIPVSGPVDAVGAGDSATAGIVPALCCGSILAEAAEIGNLVASLTVQQLGTTGSTTRTEVRRQNAR